MKLTTIFEAYLKACHRSDIEFANYLDTINGSDLAQYQQAREKLEKRLRQARAFKRHLRAELAKIDGAK